MTAASLPRRRAVVLYADIAPDDDRQLRLCLRYAEEHQLEVVALAGRRPDMALGAVRAGAEVVLCPLQMGDDEQKHRLFAEQLAQLGAQLVYARPRMRPTPVDAETALIRTALANSAGNVALVAGLLGLSRARVAAAGGHQRRRLATIRVPGVDLPGFSAIPPRRLERCLDGSVPESGDTLDGGVTRNVPGTRPARGHIRRPA